MTSLRQQLTRALLTRFALLLAGSSVAIYVVTRVSLVKEFDAALQTKALTMMAMAQQDHAGVQMDLPGPQPQGWSEMEAHLCYELWQLNGKVCARSESLGGTDLPRRFGTPAAPAIWDLVLPGGRPGRAMGFQFTPAMDDEAAKPLTPMEAVVVVAGDRENLDHTLAVLALVLALTAVSTLLVTVPVVNFSVRRGHAALSTLAGQAAAITAQSLQSRFPTESVPEELRPITGRLNDLLQRLEASFQRERRFSSDLAHELRTPLAELRALAEVELAWPEDKPSANHREVLAVVLQMEGLLSRLLELARSEAGTIPLQIEPLLLAPFIAELWAPLATKADKKQLRVALRIPAENTVETDKVLFRSMVLNLLSNAVEYTPTGGRIEIVWHEPKGELTIINTVQDLDATDLPHLFERLWRKDPSRTGTEHCGLGLALSRSWADLLGYKLEAEMRGKDTLALLVRF